MHYLASIKLPCSRCLVSDVDKDCSTISLKLNLDASDHKLGKFETAMKLCSFLLKFDPHNVNTLFKREKVAFVLHDVQQALNHLKEVVQIDLNNLEILKEVKIIFSYKKGVKMLRVR